MTQSKTISIGIPTFEAGPSLVKTVNSILRQTSYDKIQSVLIAVDGNSIEKKILDQIQDKKIRIIYFKDRKGQSTRINDILKLTNTDILILTNDDVILSQKVVSTILEDYFGYDLVGANVLALKEKGFLNRILETGQIIRHLVALNWNKGNNYLGCNGRLIVLSNRFYKKISIPEKVWNNDAYIYIKSQILGMKFKYAQNLYAYYKAPTHLNDHLNQSSKFQKSHNDLQRYFNEEISNYYKVPFGVQINTTIKTLVDSPFYTLSYLFLLFATRIKSLFSRPEYKVQGFWKTDRSTKGL